MVVCCVLTSVGGKLVTNKLLDSGIQVFVLLSFSLFSSFPYSPRIQWLARVWEATIVGELIAFEYTRCKLGPVCIVRLQTTSYRGN